MVKLSDFIFFKMSTQNTYISQSLWFLWVGALIINTISFLTIWYKIHPSGLPVALHYTVLSGIDILGPGTELYKVPFIGSLVFVVNLILSFRLRKDQFL